MGDGSFLLIIRNAWRIQLTTAPEKRLRLLSLKFTLSLFLILLLSSYSAIAEFAFNSINERAEPNANSIKNEGWKTWKTDGIGVASPST